MTLRALAFSAFAAFSPATAADPVPAPPATAVTAPFQLKDGDTVVLLGDTFFERDYNYGHLETALMSAGGKAVRVRNLGWSGDTPRCESRSYFGPPAEGFDRLKKQLAEIKPTVVIACYGAVDAFHGDAGIAGFLESYRKLIAMVQKTTGARLVLMSPPAVSTDAARWPALKDHPAKQAAVRDAVKALAGEQGLVFADLFEAMKGLSLSTVNGVTLTDADYRAAAPAMVRSLGLPMDEAAASAALNNPALSDVILEKNRLFFHRWRPQNETYLFGFRKHEQGNNGVEIPQFDPLIAEKEKEIAALIVKK